MGVASSTSKKRRGFQATENQAPSSDDVYSRSQGAEVLGDDATVLSADSVNTPDTAEAFACNQVETVAEPHPSSRGWPHTAMSSAGSDAEARRPGQQSAQPHLLFSDRRQRAVEQLRSSPRSITREGGAETARRSGTDWPNSPPSSPEGNTGIDHHELAPAIEFVRGPIVSNRWGLDLDGPDFDGAGKARQGSADDSLCLICSSDRLSASGALDCGHSYCQICIGMLREKGLDTACHLCRYKV